jgi:signal transduction histidine kinase
MPLPRRGRPEGALVMHFDVTERKQAQEERTAIELQLRQAQKLEAIGQLAAGIAHEINTPTQYIGDNASFLKDAFNDLGRLLQVHRRLHDAVKAGVTTPELLSDVEQVQRDADADYLAAEAPRAIAQILEGVERVARIVRAMKEFSHPGTAEKTLINLNHAIENTLTVSRSEWKYVAEAVTDLAPDLPEVPCLPGEINQVILNLVVNAAHAIADVVADGSRGKGVINVRTCRDGDCVELRICDNGTGIPEKARARIFEPFFTTKPVGKGTGQGLAIARSVVVDKHGGTIEFETELGKGTTFIIRLPLKPTDKPTR